MTDTLNNYDTIAGQYDFLSRLVFGKAQVRAQADLLPYVMAGSRVLIVGGGTGWILEELAARYPSGLRITYVEISGKMIALAKKRDAGRNEIVFVHAPVEAFGTQEGFDRQAGFVRDERYDAILTGFLFDNFSPVRAAAVFSLLDGLLEKGGHWLLADFFYQKGRGRLWQGVMLKAMYWFFGWLCRVEGRELVDTAPLFGAAGYFQLYTASHYGGFIQSVVYEKKERGDGM